MKAENTPLAAPNEHVTSKSQHSSVPSVVGRKPEGVGDDPLNQQPIKCEVASEGMVGYFAVGGDTGCSSVPHSKY